VWGVDFKHGGREETREDAWGGWERMYLHEASPGSDDIKQKRVSEHRCPGHQGGSQPQTGPGLALPGLELGGWEGLLGCY